MSEPYIRAFIPACEGFGWTGGPGFSTTIITRRNGRERRNADWSQPQHSFSLPFNALSQAQYAPVKAMHLNRQGAWGCFLYRDPLDFEAVQEVFGIGDGETTTFQLAKRSLIDGVPYYRNVYALYSPGDDGEAIPSAPVVRINGTPESVSIDYDRGTVTFAEAPEEGVTLDWTGEFSVWVRFVSDRMPMTISNKGSEGFWIEGSIDLLEQPAPLEPTS